MTPRQTDFVGEPDRFALRRRLVKLLSRRLFSLLDSAFEKLI